MHLHNKHLDISSLNYVETKLHFILHQLKVIFTLEKLVSLNLWHICFRND